MFYAGRGEVWISGAPVSAGYFKQVCTVPHPTPPVQALGRGARMQADKTAEAYIEQDGKTWFRTGEMPIGPCKFHG